MMLPVALSQALERGQREVGRAPDAAGQRKGRV